MTVDRDRPYNDLPLLPPAVALETVPVLKRVIAARTALADLKGAGALIPNQAILLQTIGLQEARLSSEIENVVTTTDQLYRAMSDDPRNADPAAREVLAYGEALWRGYEAIRQAGRPLSARLFEELVATIKRTDAGVRRIPGTKLATPAGRIIYTPPEGETRLRDLLANLERFLHADDGLDPLVKMAVMHYQFEAIHPFTDGNGRTGRILNLLFLVERGLLDIPVLYLSRFILERKADYYRRNNILDSPCPLMYLRSMTHTVAVPTTLAGAIKYFANKDVAQDFLVALRWPEGIFCPRCACTEYSYLSTRRLWKCKGCQKQFSVKLGTIFEDSPIGLDKWLPAIWLLVNAKNGISSYELHRALGVTQKTAWFMLHRIRLAMQTETFARLSGEVEVDETYIGGKARFMHPERKARMLKGRRGGITGKAAVMGLLSRDERKGHSAVHAEVLPGGRSRVGRADAKAFVEGRVEAGATVYSDEHKSYVQLRRQFVHHVIDHGVGYARGQVHINGLENFWSLLKRGLRGTYVSVEPFHLFRYLDEQVFRFNNRKTKDVARFISTVGQIINKRLTYAQLIGADIAPATT